MLKQDQNTLCWNFIMFAGKPSRNMVKLEILQSRNIEIWHIMFASVRGNRENLEEEAYGSKEHIHVENWKHESPKYKHLT